MRFPSRSLFFFAGAIAVLAGTALAKSFAPIFLFPDVEEGTYFTESVGELVRKGILKGYEDGRFGPHDFVTRAQVAVMLQRYHHNVIRPLQLKVEHLLIQLDLGHCGNGGVDIGEECDDGNGIEGDGCGVDCLLEREPEPPTKCEGGYDVGESFLAPDGCNTCTCTESGIACTEMACPPEECVPCGNECYPRGVTTQFKCLPTTERFDCVFDADEGRCVKVPSDKAMSCEEKEQNLADLIRSHRACRTNDDCRVLVRGCSPYLTCGQPVNKANFEAVVAAIEEYVAACPEEGPVACAACAQRQAVCERGVCRLDPPVRCSEEVRVCPDGTEVRRNPDFDCHFDPCSEEGEEEGENP